MSIKCLKHKRNNFKKLSNGIKYCHMFCEHIHLILIFLVCTKLRFESERGELQIKAQNGKIKLFHHIISL